MDFKFNRLCDHHPIGNRTDGALLVSVITPLNDDYELYENGKCVLESADRGRPRSDPPGRRREPGSGATGVPPDREVPQERTTAPCPNRPDASCGTVPKITASAESDSRHSSEMLTEAEYFVAGQPLKIKATAPRGASDEAMEYLIRNTFNKMGYLKRLPNRSRRSRPSCGQRHRQGDPAFQSDEDNPEAIDDVRTTLTSARRPASRSSCTT